MSESDTQKTFRSIRNAFGNKKKEEKPELQLEEDVNLDEESLPEQGEAKKSALESLLRGGVQGMTLGLQEKGSALAEKGIAEGSDIVKNLLDKLGVRKKTENDEAIHQIYKDKTLGSLESDYDQQNKEAEEANPKTFMGGELAADALLASAGVGALSKLSKFKKAANVSKAVKSADETPTVVAKNIDKLSKKMPVKDRRELSRLSPEKKADLDKLGHNRSPNTGEHNTMMDQAAGKKYKWASEKSLEQLSPKEGSYFKNLADSMKKYGIKDPSELKQLQQSDRQKVINEVMDLINKRGQ